MSSLGSEVLRHGKDVIRHLLFRDGALRTVRFGPYRGIRYRVSPALQDRLCLFYQAYEPEVTAKLQQWIRPGATVLDVGGHVGVHALYCAKLAGPGGRVIAFEAWPDNYRQLCPNLEANPCLPLTAVNKAVSALPGRIDFARGETPGCHHVAEPGEPVALSVETVTLDDYCSRNHIRPEVILMDIEGHEIPAIQGGEQTIREYRPKLVIEYHKKAKLVRAYLESLGYDAFEVNQREIYAWASKPSSRAAVPGAG